MHDFPKGMAVALVLALAAAGGAGYYAYTLQTERDAAAQELAGAREQLVGFEGADQTLSDLKGQLATCTGELEEKSKQCSHSEAAIEELRGDLDATRAELVDVRKQRAEAAKRIAAFKELTTQFQRMIDAGRLDVVVRNGQMMVKLPAGVLFEPGKVELSRDGELALMEVAVVLRKFEDRKFMVIGHTDGRPLEDSETTYRNNWELSTARAVNVVRFLIEARMKPQNLLAAGLGEHDPIAKNSTPKGRQQNRRIEIVMLPDLGELPTMPPELVD